MEIDNPKPINFSETLFNVTNTTEENFESTLRPLTCLSWHKLHRIKNGFLPTVEQFGILLQRLSLSDDQQDQLSRVWEDEFQEKITLTDVANEVGVEPGTISRRASSLQNERVYAHTELIDAIRKYYIKKANCEGEEEASTDIKVPKRREKRKELKVDIAEKIDLGYPDVITGIYYDSLTSAEKNAVIHLKNTSFSNPINLIPSDALTIEYMIKERTFPQGAVIRRKKLGAGYYLEYNSLAKPNSI